MRFRNLTSDLLIPYYRRRLTERKKNPFKFAIDRSSLPLLQHCHECSPGDVKILKHALLKGSLPSVQWLFEHDYQNMPESDVLFGGEEDDRYIVDIAARNPHIEVLRWILSRGYRGSSEPLRHAGLSNHLEHLKLLGEHSNLNTYDAMRGALHGNGIDVVRWLYSNGERGRGLGDSTGNPSRSGWNLANIRDARLPIVQKDSFQRSTVE